MAELFRSHNYGPQKVEWLRWKYFDNPDGRAKIFVGEDPEGKIIALRAHMPRYFTSQRTGKFFVRNSVDMFVAESYRGTGVYTAVWKLCRTGDYPIIGFPNKRAKQLIANMPGDVRIDYPIDEWWYPLALGNLYGKNNPLASVADAFSKVYSFLYLGRRPREAQMKPVQRFERDYSLEPEYIQGVRSAEFLNWRFIDNPIDEYCVYEFCSKGESLGYCVYFIEASVGKIYDLVLTGSPRSCLRLLMDHLREKGAAHLIFKSIGFQMRRYGFIRIGSPGYFDILNTPQGKWKITLADKD